MCDTKQEKAYMQALLDLTTKFGSVSSTVREIEQALAHSDHADWSALVRTIQEHERLKLHATLHLHVLRKAHAFETFAWQRDEASSISGSAHEGARAWIPTHARSASPA